MTEDPTTATQWVATLRARGVTVSLRNNRLQLQPHIAFSELSDSELLFLRHNREAIKAVVAAGPSACPRTTPPSAPDPTGDLSRAVAPRAAEQPQPPKELPPEQWAAVGLWHVNGVVTHALGDEHALQILRGDISLAEAREAEQRARRNSFEFSR